MPFQDFREFLDALRSSGELIDVDRPVALELEVAKAMRKSASIAGPAVVFKQNGTQIPARRRRVQLARQGADRLRLHEDNAFDEIVTRLKTRIPPKYVDDGPVHENVILGDDIDLSILPVPRYSPDDGGPYITPGFVVSHDPETGIPDIGHYRLRDHRRQARCRSWRCPTTGSRKNHAKAQRMGHKTFRAALVIGVDPMIAYTVPDPGAGGHQRLGGRRRHARRGRRTRQMPHQRRLGACARRVGHRVRGRLHPDRRSRGRWASTPATTRPASIEAVARPTAITHRNGAYFQALLTGRPTTENHILKQLSFEASFYDMMRQQFPTSNAVAIPPSGGVYFRVVIAMRPRYSGEARSAILAAMGSNLRPKTVIVVDPDIDVHDSEQVEWAMAFRTQPARDVIIVDEPARRTAGPDGRRIVAAGSAHRVRRSASTPPTPTARWSRTPATCAGRRLEEHGGRVRRGGRRPRLAGLRLSRNSTAEPS